MSSGLECAFVKLTTTGEWWYMLENWDSPKGASDWREYANAYGPFTSEEEADEHLRANHANPGGSSTDDAYEPDDVMLRLIQEAGERQKAQDEAVRAYGRRYYRVARFSY